jgi:hypothetical protein
MFYPSPSTACRVVHEYDLLSLRNLSGIAKPICHRKLQLLINGQNLIGKPFWRSRSSGYSNSAPALESQPCPLLRKLFKRARRCIRELLPSVSTFSRARSELSPKVFEALLNRVEEYIKHVGRLVTCSYRFHPKGRLERGHCRS